MVTNNATCPLVVIHPISGVDTRLVVLASRAERRTLPPHPSCIDGVPDWFKHSVLPKVVELHIGGVVLRSVSSCTCTNGKAAYGSHVGNVGEME